MLTISIGQALLILIKQYKNNACICDKLKNIYLSGLYEEGDYLYIQQLCLAAKDNVLKGYEISYDAAVINEDPVRRYFETHLAYETLKDGLKQLPDSFCDYVAFVYKHLAGYSSLLNEPELMRDVNDIGKGIFAENEFSHYIKSVRRSYYLTNLSTNEKIKLNQLTYLALLISQIAHRDPTLPLNIYDADYYAPEHRGRTKKDQSIIGESCHLGLMKNYMPVPPGDIATTEQTHSVPRAADKFTYQKDSVWITHHFSLLTHPFAASISGYMLCQLRYMRRVAEIQMPLFMALFGSDQKIISYMKVFIASLLYQSGGHSLYEFVAPFSLQGIRTSFKFIKNFERISLYTLFWDNNERAFNQALADTLSYQDMYLKKAKVLESIRTNNTPLKTTLKTSFAPVSTSSQWRFFPIARVNHLLESVATKLLALPMLG